MISAEKTARIYGQLQVLFLCCYFTRINVLKYTNGIKYN